MTQFNIYAIKLTQNKHFILCDLSYNDTNDTTYEGVKDRCKMLYKYTRKYSPIDVSIITTIRSFDEYRLPESFAQIAGLYSLPDLADSLLSKELLYVDFYVKQYMIEYGVSNVRGGSYIDEFLPEYVLKFLNSELKFVKTGLNDEAKLIKDVYAAIQELDKKEDIINKKEYIEKKLERYDNINLEYNNNSNIIIKGICYEFVPKTLDDIIWLGDYIKGEPYTEPYTENHNDRITKYEILMDSLFKLEYVYNSFIKMNSVKNALLPCNIFYNFFLDPIEKNMHECFYENSKQTSKLDALDVCKKYEIMYYDVKKYLDEIKFEISTFPSNFEKKSDMLIYYYNEINKNNDIQSNDATNLEQIIRGALISRNVKH